MSLQPTRLPLTLREFDREGVGFCAGCGCGCGYILYQRGGKVVDLYGNPADPRGVGSLCTRGIAYIQEIPHSPMRLKGIYARKGQEFVRIEYSQAIESLRERLFRGKTAFLLGRQAGLEEYALARDFLGEVFVDAPVVDFAPSTLRPTQWKGIRFILSIDAEPVFSEVMATRWLVDAVEGGAYLFCLSSRYETLCAKAKERLLLKPDLMLQFLQSLLSPERGDARVEFVRKSLYLMRGSLVLAGSHLLNSPFRDALLSLLSALRRKFGINYSLVGDAMPFPAKPLEEFFERLEEFDNLVVIGNLFRYMKDQHLDALKGRYVVSFQLFPNITAHYSDLLFAMSLFHEREFINYRHGFGYLVYSPGILESEGVYHPHRVLKEVSGRDPELDKLLREYGVDYGKLVVEGEAVLGMEDLGAREEGSHEIQRGETFLYTDSTLVEDLGHWIPWTHEMERLQKAYINPHTAKRLGVRDNLELGGVRFELIITENVAEGVIFIPSEYEELQPFDPGHRAGAFLKRPFHRYEVFQ